MHVQYNSAQVLRDWKKRLAAPGDPLSEKEMDSVATSLKKFMEGNTIENNKRPRAQAQDKIKESRLSNALFVKALDHALQSGMNKNLKMFRPSNPVCPIKTNQKQYFIDGNLEGLEQEEGRVIRSCIEESDDTGVVGRRLELVADIPRPSLHVCLDRGSIGWTSALWMFLGQKIRGTFLPDPLHMAWGDVKNAVEDAGLGHVKLEAILLFSFASGPWKGAAFFQNVKDASLDFFHGLPGQKADELFSLMYDDICKDLGLCCTAEYGTPEHMKYVREQASQCSVFQKKGEKVKLSRFFSFIRKAREFESCWWSLACVLLYTGMLSRWWSGLDETPLYSHHRGPAAEGGVLGLGAGAAAHAPPPEGAQPGVAASNFEIEELRARCKNTLHVASTILCNRFSRNLIIMIAMCSEPLEMDFNEMTVDLKTQQGTLAWWFRTVQYGFNYVLQQVMNSFTLRTTGRSQAEVPRAGGERYQHQCRRGGPAAGRDHGDLLQGAGDQGLQRYSWHHSARSSRVKAICDLP